MCSRYLSVRFLLVWPMYALLHVRHVSLYMPQLHDKNGIYKLTCQTRNSAYVGQTSRNLTLRYREQIRYVKNNDPQSVYAQLIL